MRECARPGCGQPLVRGRTEPLVQWSARRYCSRACSNESEHRGFVIKLDKPVAMGRTALAQTLRTCVGCGCVIPKPDTLTWARYRAKTTCGSQACKDRQAARPATGGPSEIVADVTTLHRPTPKQRLAWQQAPESERRLFAPEIRAAMGAGY